MQGSKTRVLFFLFRLGTAGAVTMLAHWLRGEVGRLPLGHYWHWSLVTMLIYLPVALYIEFNGRERQIGGVIGAGYVISWIIPGLAGAVMFGVLLGAMLAVAAYWDRSEIGF